MKLKRPIKKIIDSKDLTELIKIVIRQQGDSGLLDPPNTVREQHAQQAVRQLHRVIEKALLVDPL